MDSKREKKTGKKTELEENIKMRKEALQRKGNKGRNEQKYSHYEKKQERGGKMG